VPQSGSGADLLAQILATPLIRCDQAQWSLFGISLAGFNALFSFAGAITIWTSCLKRP
jgi:disulfide bond formation protein DsbB